MEEEVASETATPSNNTPPKNALSAEKVASPLLKADNMTFDDDFSYMEEDLGDGNSG